MKNPLLLLEDIDELGRSGDVVTVKPGYARNYLLPQKKAILATKQTIRLQEELKAARLKQAASDKKEAESLAQRLEGAVFHTSVKVDQEGHMYGSVSAGDIVELFAHEQISITKRNVLLPHPIKMLGIYDIQLKLKEGVPARITLEVIAEDEKQM